MSFFCKLAIGGMINEIINISIYKLVARRIIKTMCIGLFQLVAGRI